MYERENGLYGHRRPFLFLALVLAAVMVMASGAAILPVGRAAAHGNPEVTMDPNPAPFSGEVTLEGEGFEEETEVSLFLEGIVGEISLGSATTDDEGAFSISVTLPAGAVPGGYRVRAVTADETAVADVRIVEGESGQAPTAAHELPLGFHRVDSASEIAGFSVLAAALALLAAGLLWLPGREGRA